MNKKLSIIFFSLGLLFLINAVLGRYIVLPGYLAGLEQGQATLKSASQAVSGWKVMRYLLWAYSFKLGIYFILLGGMFRTQLSSRGKWIFIVGGLLYIAFAYIPLPSPDSIIFGLAGVLMTLFIIFTIIRWANERENLEDYQRTASDYRMAGYLFFAMATYTLCPLMGVKAFALTPEKMIAYGLEGEAASFAFHLLIELVLGWLFTSLSYRKAKQAVPANLRHSFQ